MVATSEILESDILSRGVYTRAQAAHIARLRPQTVTRWYDDNVGSGAAILRALPEMDGDRAVSFVELVQLMAIRAIRLDYDISLQKIRQTVVKAHEMGIKWPLAQETITIHRFGGDLVLGLPDGSYIQASGTLAKHYLIEPVILPYLEDIKFDSTTQLASIYRPKAAPEVFLDPRRHWGAPFVESCNYTVASLVNAVHSEKTIKAAARMCEVKEADIVAALQFEDFLRGASV